MAKENLCCPMKFRSRTLTDDGFVRKNTCECDETRCAWWNSENSACAVVMLALGTDSIQKLDKIKLKLMLSSGKDKESIEAMRMATPYLEA